MGKKRRLKEAKEEISWKIQEGKERKKPKKALLPPARPKRIESKL